MWARWNNRFATAGLVLMVAVSCSGCATPVAVTPVSTRPTPGTRLVFDRVVFDAASDQLSTGERWKVEQNARAMRAYGDVVILVEGLIDAREAPGSARALADRRARAVAETLMAAGVDPERIAGPVSRRPQAGSRWEAPRRVEMSER